MTFFFSNVQFSTKRNHTMRSPFRLHLPPCPCLSRTPRAKWKSSFPLPRLTYIRRCQPFRQVISPLLHPDAAAMWKATTSSAHSSVSPDDLTWGCTRVFVPLMREAETLWSTGWTVPLIGGSSGWEAVRGGGRGEEGEEEQEKEKEKGKGEEEDVKPNGCNHSAPLFRHWISYS